MADPVKKVRNAVGNLGVALDDVDPWPMSREDCVSLIRVLRGADEIVEKALRRVRIAARAKTSV